MAQIKVADIFAQLGIRADVRKLDAFQKRLVNVKRQLLDLKRLARTPLSPNTNIAAVRALNTELARTQRLARSIQQQGPIRVRRSGGAGGGRGGSGGGAGGRLGGFGSGLLAGGGAGRVPAVARNFVGAFTATLAVRKLFQASAQLQGIEVALGAVTREGQTTAEVMAFLRGEANRLGFDFASSALEYAKLAAAGNSVNLELETVNEVFIAAQEAARVFNLSVSDTEGVLKAFTQIISKGKITAEELRNQLGDRLPGAVGIFAKALGVTTQELSKMLETGQVLADDKTLLAVAKELRSTVASQVDKASKNLTASLNRFTTAFFEFSASIGRAGINDVFQVFLDGSTVLLKALAPAFRALAFAINALLIPFKLLFRIFSRLNFEAMPLLLKAIIVLTGAVIAATVANKLWALSWVKALAPILGMIAIGTAIILIIEDLKVAMDGGSSVIGDMAENGGFLASTFAQILLVIGETISFMAQLTAAVFNLSFDGLVESAKRFVEQLQRLNFISASSEKLVELAEAIGGVFGGTNAEEAGRLATQTTFFDPSRIPRSGAGAAGSTNVEVIIKGDTEVVAGVAARVNDGQLRQAHGESPSNE